MMIISVLRASERQMARLEITASRDPVCRGGMCVVRRAYQSAGTLPPLERRCSWLCNRSYLWSFSGEYTIYRIL